MWAVNNQKMKCKNSIYNIFKKHKILRTKYNKSQGLNTKKSQNTAETNKITKQKHTTFEVWKTKLCIFLFICIFSAYPTGI